MKIQKIYTTLQDKLAKKNLIRRKAKIDKYIKIHDTATYGDSFNQMYNAREIIANYAEKKGITVDIYDARKLLEGDENVSPIIEEQLSDKINVVVTNLLNGKSKAKIVSANTDKNFPKVATAPIIIPIPKDNTDIVRTTIRQTNDSFIRNLFRNIESLTKIVTGKNTK